MNPASGHAFIEIKAHLMAEKFYIKKENEKFWKYHIHKKSWVIAN